MTWTTVALRDIGRWSGGGTPSKGRPEFWTEGTIPWLSPKDMRGEVLHDTKDHITPEAVVQSAARLVPSGSVAVVTRSGILERTLPVAYVPFETTLNQDLRAVVARPDVDPRWIAWGLRRYEREILATTRKAGTTVASIEVPRLMAFPLPVPRLQEQRRIVEILEEHLSHLDAAAADLTRAHVRLESLSEAALRLRIPSHTVRRPLSDVLELPLSNGRSVPSRDGGFPVLRLTALKEDGVDLGERKGGAWERDEAVRFLVKQGDFLIARGNGSLRLVGKGSLLRHEPDEVAFPDTAIRARARASAVLPEFLSLVWNARSTRDQIERVARTSAGIYKVNQSQLGAIQLPVPELSEQLSIIDAMSRLQEHRHVALETIDLATRRSRSLRRAVLAAAFEGKLTGRHTDLEVVEKLAEA